MALDMLLLRLWYLLPRDFETDKLRSSSSTTPVSTVRSAMPRASCGNNIAGNRRAHASATTMNLLKSGSRWTSEAMKTTMVSGMSAVAGACISGCVSGKPGDRLVEMLSPSQA